MLVSAPDGFGQSGCGQLASDNLTRNFEDFCYGNCGFELRLDHGAMGGIVKQLWNAEC